MEPNISTLGQITFLDMGRMGGKKFLDLVVVNSIIPGNTRDHILYSPSSNSTVR